MVVNVFESPTAIWLYSRNLIKVNNRMITVYDAFPKSGIISKIEREIQMTSDAYLGTHFLHRKITGYEFDILHYADPIVPPVMDPQGVEHSVVTIHDNPVMLIDSDLYSPNSLAGKITKNYLKRNFEKYKEFDRVLVVSDYVRNSLIRYGFTGQTDTIYLPITPYFRHLDNKIALRRELGLPLHKKLILSVSTKVKRKNLILIEKALRRMDKSYRLVRVGERIGESITFTNVDNETVNRIYNACDVLVIPSFEEGLGLPVIEAFAAGIPVVASDIEVFHEIGGGAPEYIDPYSVDSLVSGIPNALSTSDEKITLGYEMAKKFSFDIFRTKMTRYYERLNI